MYTQFLLLFLLVVSPWICQGETDFNQEKSLIWFEINEVMFNHEAFDSTRITKMVDIISSKFTKIITKLTEEEMVTADALIPKIIATMNAERKQDTETPPLELQIIYPSQNSSTGLLTFIKALSEEANRIFPGTVTTIFLDSYPLTCEQLKDEVDSFVSIMSGTAYPYHLGLDLWLSQMPMLYQCITRNTSFQYSFSKISRLLIIDLLKPGDDESYHLDLHLIFEKFEDAKRALAKATRLSHRDEFEIAFQIEYTYSPAARENNDEGQVELWKKINDWTTHTNNTYVFFQAFDSPGNFSKQGWWRRSRSKSSHSSLYQFEEKEAVLDEEKLEKLTERQATQDYEMRLCEYGMSALLIFIILFSVSLWMICSRKLIVRM